MKKSIDMTQGTPWRLIISFAIPIVLGSILQQIYNITDTAIVGRFLGINALAAVSANSSITWFINSFSLGITHGLVVITSQRYGAKDTKGVKDSLALSIVVCAVMALILTIIACIFTDELLRLVNVPENIFTDTYQYTITIFSGLTATIFYNFFASALRAIGDSKTPVIILAISSIINLILDIVFIKYLHMGVLGAALATVIATFFSCIVCCLLAFKKHPIVRLTKENWRINPRYLWAHIKLGLPMALQFSVTSIGNIISSSSYINTLGPTALAAFSTASKVELIPAQMLSAIGATSSTFTAQNKGADNYERIKSGVKSASIIMIIIAVIGSVFMLASSDLFVRLIVGKNQYEQERLVFRYIVALCPTLFTLGTIHVYRNALQGMGQAFMPFIIGIFELVTRVISAAVFIPMLGFDGAGVSYNLTLLTPAVCLFVTYIVYMRKNYKTAFKTQKESA